MKEIAAIIILFSVIRLSSYGAWNIKEKKNMTGAVGTLILSLAMIFFMATVLLGLT